MHYNRNGLESLLFCWLLSPYSECHKPAYTCICMCISILCWCTLVHITATILLLGVTCVPDIYKRLAMGKILVVHLINHVIGCMVRCIKRIQQAWHYIGTIVVGFAKYGSYCGLFSWIRDITTTKSTKISMYCTYR